MSGRKDNLEPFQNIIAGNMSADVYSSVTNIKWLDNLVVQLGWTGSPVGAFAIEVSLDYLPGTGGTVLNAGTWTALTISPSPTAAGSADTAIIDLSQLSMPWLRVHYIRSSGSGTLTGYIAGKML